MGAMRLIVNSVGNGGANVASDVRVVQELLNRCISYLIPVRQLKVDGDCGPITIGVILEFQRRVMGLRSPRGRIHPGQSAIRKLNELAANPACHRPVRPNLASRLPVLAQAIHERIAAAINALWGISRGASTLREADYQRGASLLGADVAVMKAVARVESRGGGFLEDARPKILFEGHVFSRETKGKYDKSHPTISHPRWTKMHYVGGVAEYSRLEAAAALEKGAGTSIRVVGHVSDHGLQSPEGGVPFGADVCGRNEEERGRTACGVHQVHPGGGARRLPQGEGVDAVCREVQRPGLRREQVRRPFGTGL